MWIVELALRRPYTIAVMSILILVMGVLSVTRMVVDIFPAIDIPVVAVVWNYPRPVRRGHGAAGGAHHRARLLDARSTASSGSSRSRSPASGCSRSTSSPTPTSAAPSRRSARCPSTILRITPPGMQPPNVIHFNASNVPVAQLTMSQRDAARAADLRLRPELHPRAAVHHPRPVHAGAVRRQAAPDQRRHRSAGARGQAACRRPTW